MVLTERGKALRPLIQATLDEGGIDAICELLAALEVRVAEFEARIVELEKRLGKNSGRKPGGHPGHPGQALHQSQIPDMQTVMSHFPASVRRKSAKTFSDSAPARAVL